LSKVKSYNLDNKKSINYVNVSSVTKPVPYGPNDVVPISPKKVDNQVDKP